MRVKNSIYNVKYNMFFFIVNSILAFVSKTILIRYIGTEYTGLNSVFSNLIGLMSVAELGIGTAVTYSLYDPLRKKDYEKLNDILLFFKYIYRFIGIFIFVFSIIISLFLSKIVNSSSISFSLIIFYYFIFVLISVSSYFLTYIQIVAVASQKSFIITKVSGKFNIIKVIIQIILTIITNSYFIWICLELIFTISNYIVINKKVKQAFPWFIAKSNKNLKYLLKDNKKILIDTKNLFFHKIGGIVLNQTDSIVLSTFTNLSTVTIHSNYNMITKLFNSLVVQFYQGIRASVGDYISEKQTEETYNLFKNLSCFSNFISLIISFCFYFNINNLIKVWLGEEFLFTNFIVLTISLNLYIQLFRHPVDIFKEGYGLFWDKWAPLIEAIINLILSIILAKRIGIGGVIIGTLVSNSLIIVLWRPYVLFKYGFKFKIEKFFINIYMRNLILSIFTLGISNFIVSNTNLSIENSILSFLIQSIYSLIVISVVYFSLSLLENNHLNLYKNYLLKTNFFRKINYINN